MTGKTGHEDLFPVRKPVRDSCFFIFERRDSMMTLRKTILGGFFIGLGIVLPMAFHLVNLGRVFLPMHIPVLMSGFFCGPIIGLIVGFITPLLSGLLTGMPPFMPPTAQGMMVELAAYGFLTGFFHHRLKLNNIVSLLGAMFLGRVVYGLFGALVFPLFGLKGISPIYPITAGLITGLPGIALQLIIIPTTLYFVERGLKTKRLES
jgi:hypothetical protein